MSTFFLVGDFRDQDEHPDHGRVIVTPSVLPLSTPAGQMIAWEPIRGKVDKGLLSMELPANDSTPQFSLTVEVRMNSGRQYYFTMAPDEPGVTVEFDKAYALAVGPAVGLPYASLADLAGVESRVDELEAAPAPVTSWADLADKPTIPATAEDVGALPADETVPDANLPARLTAEGLSATIATGAQAASGAPTLVVNRIAADLGLTCDKTGADDAAPAWQATLDMVGGSGFGAIRVVAEPGTYLVRNLNPKSNTHIDLTGVTLRHGGTRAGTTVEGSTATINANGTSGAPITGLRITGGTLRGVRVDYTNITGVGGNDGIYLHQCPGAVVEGVTLTEHGQDAVTFHDSDGAKFLRNTVTNCGDAGIELRAGSNYEVVGNTFTKVRNAVATKPNLTDVRVDSNHMTTFAEGILIHGVRWRVTRNTILPITADAIDGTTSHAIRYADEWSGSIPTNSGSDILIEGNAISGRTTASALFFATLSGATTLKRVTFRNNQVIGCNRGVQNSAAAVSGINVSGNQMTATDRGVWAAAGTDWTIENNQITATANPPIESLAPGAIIRGNSVSSSTVAGIRTTVAGTDNVIEGNSVVTTSGPGILVQGAGAAVSSNRVSSAGAAISVAAANAAISGNRLASTGGEAVLLASGSTGAVVTGNIATSGTQGVRVSANDCTVTGNRLTGMQFWGLNISAGVTGTLHGSNMLKGNTSGALTDAGTGTTVSGVNITA